MIVEADARAVPLKDNSVQCVVTSPPYWGLRDYGIAPSLWGGDPNCEHLFNGLTRKSGGAYAPGSKKRWQHSADDFGRDDRFIDGHPEIPVGSICQCGAWFGCLGLEPTPELYVGHIVQVFREVRRVLKNDGTVWLNIGDSYATGAGSVGDCPGGGEQGARWRGDHPRDPKRNAAAIPLGPTTQPNRMPIAGLKPKDLVGIPWRVAFALQADGWYLRSDIIWSKPNPMPESVTDRPTKAHEYVFLLSKNERYFFDQDAVREAYAPASFERWNQDIESQEGSYRVPGKTNGTMKAVGGPISHKGSSFLKGKTGINGNGRVGEAERTSPRSPRRWPSAASKPAAGRATWFSTRSADRGPW